MAKSNAERQAAYRKRHAGECERLNTMISAQAKRALEQLAGHYGVAQREVLERAVLEMLRQVLIDVRQPSVMLPEQQDTVVEPELGACGENEVIRKPKPKDSAHSSKVIVVKRRKRCIDLLAVVRPNPAVGKKLGWERWRLPQAATVYDCGF